MLGNLTSGMFLLTFILQPHGYTMIWSNTNSNAVDENALLNQ